MYIRPHQKLATPLDISRRGLYQLVGVTLETEEALSPSLLLGLLTDA
jgi:hypothetical protein